MKSLIAAIAVSLVAFALATAVVTIRGDHNEIRTGKGIVEKLLD